MSAELTREDVEVPSLQEQLSNLFGGYRAEWLRGQIFELFSEPLYFPELKTSRPCIIVGGRGSGKTTVLRGLSYEGQFALGGRDASRLNSWKMYGMYYKADTNIVTAFRGSELTEAQWVPLFGHYTNLLLCELVLRFLEWYQLTTASSIALNKHAYARLAASLQIEEPTTLKDLSERLTLMLLSFEAFINNVADRETPPLTMQGVPVKILIESLSDIDQFAGKTFCFLIDEYENFEPYQQQVINTLVKHSGEQYTFKLAVKELGWHRRTTLNLNEQLISPADYVLVDIAKKISGRQFKDFALSVCNERIARLRSPGSALIRDVRGLLPGLNTAEEAERLGVSTEIEDVRQWLEHSPKYSVLLEQLKPLELYALKSWAAGRKVSLETEVEEYLRDPRTWRTRFGNYKQALMFSLKRGKRGIRRYYCGWDTLTYLAASNIRYMLELVEQSLLAHLQEGRTLAEPVDQAVQTHAAHAVGKKNLSELEGLSVSGAQLTRLLLGLGRVFGQLAADPEGHAPEINQFELSTAEEWSADPNSKSQRVTRLLEHAVMHLALQRWPGNKLGPESDTRAYDYAVHPIFSAFFEFSYRRKRKMTMSDDDILGLVHTPTITIRSVLARHNRTEDELPQQLGIFRAYFSGTSQSTASN